MWGLCADPLHLALAVKPVAELTLFPDIDWEEPMTV
jgi:hypothetical protein